MRQIPSANTRQGRMQLNSNHGAKRIRGGKQHGAAHACAHIHKCIFIDRR
jgi:hypothetical protein